MVNTLKRTMLNVSQLIAILQTHPPDMRVVVDGYEGGYQDLAPESVWSLTINVGVRSNDDGSELFGSHDDETADWPLKEQALLLSR